MRGRITGYSILGLVLGVSFAANTLLTNRLERQPTQSYIVQATSLQQARALVAGGDVAAAKNGDRYDCANRGPDINADFSGETHHRCAASMDDDGQFYVEGVDNDRWDGSHTASDGYLWNDGMLWNDSTVTPVSINTWVEQE